MARGHPGLPKSKDPLILKKSDIFGKLAKIDSDPASSKRVLQMENEFRSRIDSHLGSLPTKNAEFQKFNTSPFVLMFYSRQKGYHHVSEIEDDIVPAKVFSSMETSAGRMVETVALPIYGWETVPSSMHSSESVLDGRKVNNCGLFRGATLKSGPRCLNDEMSKDIGRDVAQHTQEWAKTHQSKSVEFTYGVLYGTKKQSNKKDWHILRNIEENLNIQANLLSPCTNSWNVSFEHNGIKTEAAVRVGIDWWSYLGNENTWIELCCSLIRACVNPAPIQTSEPKYYIGDLGQILNLSSIPDGFNVSILQQSQWEWLLFLARHFCDELQD